MGYQAVYERSMKDPESFWAEAAELIDWDRPWDKVLDSSNAPFHRWFAGGMLNTCYNAVDRHVTAGRGDQPAIIHDSPVTGSKTVITYAELQDQVARFAGALLALGVTKGDRVIVYMPMVPEAAVAMLGCARIGAIHSVVFGGFSARELATRIDDAKPKVMVAGSCGIEPNRVVHYKPLLDSAINLAEHKPEHCIILQREQEPGTLIAGRDLGWAEALAAAEPAACVSVAATDPLYILYTSGTTGQPKGVVRDNGGHAVAMAWSMENVYNVRPGEVFWAASDVGWVVGHSYIVYAPLLAGCTTIVYEGKPVGTPDAEHLGRYDLGSLRALFLAGERCDPDTLGWAQKILGIPVIDHWWQTETGWAIAANCLGIEQLPVKPGSPTRAVPGYDIQVLDDEGVPVAPGDIGRIMIKLPLPPGCLPTLWGNDARFIQSYLSAQPGYYLTGDAGYLDEDGYLFVMSRIDDIINVAGHRLSTGAMEGVLASHPDVAECAVIGAHDQLKGELPVGLVVLKSGVSRDDATIIKELVNLVRDQIGPVAAFKTVVVVQRLPKTRSGKILRGTMKSIADGKDYRMPATIDDPTILEEIETALGEIGYAQHS
ncbi:propionyl-CoA synthetase [Thiocapsa bogorovii]|uniref:propionyl-CoA synthetase n=1 Tax=Thiocapsa bogorovii TaxID=521689 RepID=UPI001E5B6906|nr:propionyl-CoA synthetase [Thiocapsa bogorovii]UHD14650.1 propionyl-CoA synthetase [Thiocapsa bogorovii]